MEYLGSKVSHFSPEPSTFVEVTIFPEDVKQAWSKATLKEIKNIINNHSFLMGDPDKGSPVTPCMNVYNANIQSDGSLNKLKFRIVVRGDLQIR